MSENKPRYQLKHPVRFVTAAALFDGHDATINIIRRILVSSGAEVVHLGHNRSALEIVEAAIQEDAQGIAVSSYQGGHIDFFRYLIDLLAERGASHVRVFGGGGGVIVPDEIRALEDYGVVKIFSPEDGRALGLAGMIDTMLSHADFSPLAAGLGDALDQLSAARPAMVARLITLAELEGLSGAAAAAVERRLAARERPAPVVGITGTGGAGKSSLIDELVLRFARDFPKRHIAVLSVDPTKRKTGGALLGDRIRMNAIHGGNCYMRSLATRGSGVELSRATEDAIRICRAAGFDLILVETSGIGQGGAAIVEVADLSLYVMTADFGAPSQLEKIDMLDYADLIAINKFERRGSEDALRDVRKQVRRSRGLFGAPPDAELPVFGTMASQFSDPGMNRLYLALLGAIEAKSGIELRSRIRADDQPEAPRDRILPPERDRYLGEIARLLRERKGWIEAQCRLARRRQTWREALGELRPGSPARAELERAAQAVESELAPECRRLLEQWPALREQYVAEQMEVEVRGKARRFETATRSLSGLRIPKVALPPEADEGALLRFLLAENLPGRFPYTAGVFPFRRTEEDPRRQFAGEGTPERTNRRFHYLSRHDQAKRLSTAFDSVTLYGEDPDPRPDIYGKVGESGVSICSLDDMKKLFAGFDLCAPLTSVSMTINGPAPAVLAMFLNTAIDQRIEAFRSEHGREPDAAEAGKLRAETLKVVRGTVQADILKEDQAQNTCIFSTEFALRMMGDIQQYFIDHQMRNFYSVSISGYHIAEAGANPISQLAFTLANGFTYVEYYLSRGMQIDQFAPNLSFFFSNGLDPEYAVIGRVARRIWANAIRQRYGGDERSQKLKYHIQTSGRSLHAMEVDFNDIRTTLQALLAVSDNCNSLHTNAFDEAVTTPTEASVRRAVAIQKILALEFGLGRCENVPQGGYIVEQLTELVEEAVLDEFQRLSDRGGVLGAMETQYQRGKIQEESLLYESKKHSGELPIVGVNTFLASDAEAAAEPVRLELARATKEEKQAQLSGLRAFHERHAATAPAALERLQQAALSGGNLFAELMEAVRVCSLGQITRALYEVGGQYRR
ncbi:MAG TPA: fused isobutyryl-CoA mutase/GTPase IcmF, partial [Acidobacteriota bacterium]